MTCETAEETSQSVPISWKRGGKRRPDGGGRVILISGRLARANPLVEWQKPNQLWAIKAVLAFTDKARTREKKKGEEREGVPWFQGTPGLDISMKLRGCHIVGVHALDQNFVQKKRK